MRVLRRTSTTFLLAAVFLSVAIRGSRGRGDVQSEDPFTGHVQFTADLLDDDEAADDSGLLLSDDPNQNQPRFSGYGVKTSKTTYKKSKENSEACLSTFKAPENSIAVCSTVSKNCQATCTEGYRFPIGVKRMTFVCDGAKYKVKDSISNAIPMCVPVCNPPCENGGTCEKPNRCNCPKNFDGPQCRVFSGEPKACHGFPVTPMNSKKKCSSDACTISCVDGHQFPDSSTVVNVFCKNGEWTPGKIEWSTVPDCKPVCDPPCLNAGNCIGHQKCQCPTDYRGPKCQYPESSCDVSKLNFNGNFKCSDDMEKNVCTLSCPQGSILEPFRTDDVEYSCSYKSGEFEPKHIPQCVFDDQPSAMVNVISTVVEVINTSFKSRPGSCIRWGYGNYKTFDGRIYSFQSDCTYTLVSDIKSNSFHVQARFDRGVITHINVYIVDNLYQIKRNAGDNAVTMINNDKPLAVPNELSDIGVEIVSGQTVLINLRNVNLKVIWKSNGVLQVVAGASLWNSTDGLCGKMDGKPENDLSYNSVTSFANKWLNNGLNEICESPITETVSVSEVVTHEAQQFCALIKNDRFRVCSDKNLDTEAYIAACKIDYARCVLANGSDCGCSSVAAYAEKCFGEEQTTAWRDDNICPYRCPAGKLYTQCIPVVQETCTISAQIKTHNVNVYCEEGCVCPPGTVLNDGVCVSREKCPCKLRNKSYQSGDEITKDCNKCTCIAGEWSCTTAKCRAECYAIGDPHYKTFDGMKFNFMGACSYYLVVLPEFSIEAENVQCDGTASREHGFEELSSPGKGSCTKALTIRFANHTIVKLGQGKTVFINGEMVEKLPISLQGLAYIREQSSFFLQILVTNGIEIRWDGETRAYIYASPELEGKPKGLCGTYNGNQNDDMFTPEGDVETNVVSFANKWKTKESCANKKLETVIQTAHPCDVNVQYKHLAESYCKNITGKLFSDCHAQVDPVPYYDDCLYDVCSCRPGQFSRCYCQILASYALECSHQNTIIDWRRGVRDCGVQCPAGQHYEVCGNSCQRTCHDISTINSNCKSNCVEGCYCPKGLTLSEFGECIPVAECPCYNNGQKYKSGQKRIETSGKGPQICTCKSASWECSSANSTELEQWKDVSENSCSRRKHLTFVECEPPEPVTCNNMHDPPQSTPAICYSGCVCKKPYVLDSFTKECVLPTECPCHHGGKSYNNSETFYQGCNTCECNLGKWECTKNECPGTCTVWGDSHFRTFDSRYFDFQGACEYVLSKGTLTSYESFVISIEIVPCGTTGATCIKSVTLNVGSGDNVESLQLKNKYHSPNTKRIYVKDVGHFVVVEVPDLGIQIYWDRNTRVNLQVDQKWKNHIKGLCGNYNGNQMDDFETPYGGIPEVSALLFGDSWKIQSHCPHLTEMRDACVLHPHRRQWAVSQCSILKSAAFRSCHSQVSVDNFIERCIFDSCACDQGGDCECMCTAIAAYAQECSVHGVYIKWRSQELCPIQCENGTSYSPCTPICSKMSCDDYVSQKSELCEDKFCIEGCVKDQCPYGQVYANSTSNVCVPKTKCKIPCKIEGVDRVFNEGDVVVEDACHSCFCSRNKQICKGQPCQTTTTPAPTTTAMITTTTPTTTTTTTTGIPILDQSNNKTCADGWSAWISVNRLSSKVSDKFEYMPTFDDLKSVEINNVLGMCERDQIDDIQCKSLNTKSGIKNTAAKVDCSLKRGLVCNGKCNDYEIRVHCKCKKDEISIEDENTTEVVDEDKIINKTRIVCPEGFGWQNCKVMCDQVCHSFENQLRTTNMCVYPQKCIGGCLSDNKQSTPCPVGSMWRDNNTCVSKSDCTCFSRNGTQVKPGGVFKEDWCTVCQCVNNAYICDDSACKYNPTTEKIEQTTEQFYPTVTTEEPTTFTRRTTTDTEPSASTTEAERLTTTELTSTVTTTVSSTLPPTETSSVKDFETTTETTVFVPSTVTPPTVLCGAQEIKPITANSGPLSFSASSSLNNNTAPHFAQLYPNSDSYWKPETSTEGEFLEISLHKPETIYGVEISGNPLNDEYVTSYKLAYSMDGVSFSLVKFHGLPEIFRGPHSRDTVEKQILFTPVEAKYVRIIPTNWRNAIAIRFALLGCPVSSTTLDYESTTTPAAKPICSEPMGIESGLISNNMVTVSSSTFEHFNALDVSLNSKSAWVPFTASTNQWIQVDFTGPRIITGIVTKGISSTSKTGEAWTEAYRVIYSNDLINWNIIFDSKANEQIYTGNFDGESSHTVFFDTPINARYVRIHPVKWYNMPALRLEILGCFEAYATEETIIETTTTPTVHLTNCNACPGIVEKDCSCTSDSWWNGESCGLRSECPCVLGIMTYPVGTVYDLENCQQCTCTLGGLPDCAPKLCAPCPPGEVSATAALSCDCDCKPCANGTKLCPTSNVCLDEALWCNGIQDCPDDEINCLTTTSTTTTTTTTAAPTTTTTTTTTTVPTTTVVEETVTVVPTMAPPKKRGQGPCPEIKCPEGQIARILNSSPVKSNSIKFARKTRSLEIIEDDPWPSPFNPMTNLAASVKRNHHNPQFSTNDTVFRRKGGGMHFGIKSGGVKNDNQQPICKQWICEAKVEQFECKTPSIKCPEGYFLQMTPNENEICPVYTCVSNVLEESECEIDGRIFKSFDGVTFKYEICDHIIVRDRVHKKWMIKQIRRCPYVGTCQVSLWISHLNHSIEFFPNMTTTYDGYSYTVNQLQIIGSQTTQFAVKQVQTNYIIFASSLGFSIIWQVNGQVKIKVNAFYTGRIDGLCGFFDNNPKNDKLKRDGLISATTPEFGNSWADSSEQCETKICPMHIQKAALDACNAFKLEPLNQCGQHEHAEEIVMKCIENICSCSENSVNDFSECRCKAMSGLVTQCYITNSSVELSDWRILHDCPVSCPTPLVYKECFNKVCEPSCDSLLQEEPCPKLPGLCFPGCYCPDGYIKELGSCIKPAKCRNCVCEGSGTNQYTTFDKVDFTHKENCSHVLVKTTKENDSAKPGFSIIETTGKCSNQMFSNGVCVQNLTVIHAAHELRLYYNTDGSKVRAVVDGSEANKMPFINKWLLISESPGKSVTASIPILELEIIFMTMNQGFSIKMPSHLYYDKTEGLCGSCNGDSRDDMAAPDGHISVNADEFVKSWKSNRTEFEQCETIVNKVEEKESCSIPKPEFDPCLKLMDSKIFGQCHAIVDVNLYLKKCHSILCQGHEGSFCHSLEAYVRECQSFGVCLDWRSPNLCPYSCPKGLSYKACSSGCEETCDNYKALRSGETRCKNLPTEMCTCPTGQVFNNSVCVNENRCEPCDGDNHFVGDTWSADKCTVCSCSSDGSRTVHCEKKQCAQSPYVICQTGYTSVKDKDNSDECCERYKCVKEENNTQNCTDIAMPECATDQVVKIELAPNGCKRFICECKPKDECGDSTSPDKNVELLPGMTVVMNDRGCCPSFQSVCAPETCPTPGPCPAYHERVDVDHHGCCPITKCELPNNTCVYEYEWIASNEGGERKRTENEKTVDLKQVNDRWEDGPCRSCRCDATSVRGTCDKIECAAPPQSRDYVMVARPKFGQCCPSYRKESCIYDNQVYAPGSEWVSPDPCVTMSCKQDEGGEAFLTESVKSCNTECPLGWVYTPSEKSCCGTCVQQYCVMKNKTYADNDTWTYDNCTSFLCSKSQFNEFNILPVYHACPNIGNCPENRIYYDGCCEQCNTTDTVTPAESQSLCAAESLPANQTVGLVTEDSPFHDTCANLEPISGFTECRGLCDSYTYFNKKTIHHDSKCQCCQPIRFEKLSVDLQCKDGYRYKKAVSVPSACSCTACGGESFSVKKSRLL